MGNNVLHTLNAQLGQVRRAVLNGRAHLVAPFVYLINKFWSFLTAGLGSLPNTGSSTGCPAVFSVRGSLRGETKMSSSVKLKSGVYCWLNLLNGKRYVGSSAGNGGIEYRRKSHLNALRTNRHINRHLQASWNKYGESQFKFIILERCIPSLCIEREQYWLDLYKSANKQFGYNICSRAGSTLGIKFTPEARAKIRAKVLGRQWSEGARKKLSASLKGHPVSTKSRQAMDWNGRTHTEETKAKQAEYARNRPITHRENLSKGARAKKLTEEHKRKIGEAGRGRVATEEKKRKMGEFSRNMWATMTPERRKEIGRRSSEAKRRKKFQRVWNSV